MSKFSSMPPFSPAKGGATLLTDPAFEFDAPHFCNLQDDNYDFYADYEKYGYHW